MTNEIQDALEQALPSIAVRIQSELVVTAPVDTGRLKNSIKVFPTKKGLEISMVDYGIFVEFGTVSQKPNPFIRNALQIKLKKIIIEEMNRVLNAND